MRLITVGLKTPLRIPESWDCFTYKGYLYVKGKDGRFVIRGQVAA